MSGGDRERRGAGAPLPTPDPRVWRDEARRKAIHVASIVLPLAMLFEPLPWPRGRGEWSWLLLAFVLGALAIDVIRVNDRRVGNLFRTIFGGMLREHESSALLGSTYLLIAALLAVEIFPQSVAATALGFTVLGDAAAAIVGRAWGRVRFFHKSLEGAAAGLMACLLWAVLVAATGHLPWAVLIAGAFAASLIELLPIPLDDNLGVTLFAGYVMKLLWSGA